MLQDTNYDYVNISTIGGSLLLHITYIFASFISLTRLAILKYSSCMPAWIITVGHWLFVVQNGLTADRYRRMWTLWPDNKKAGWGGASMRTRTYVW